MSEEALFALTTHALNAAETIPGFSPHQWVYGKKFTLDDEDNRALLQASSTYSALDFAQMLLRRQEAEKVAREVHAQRVLAKLQNSKVRQSLQVFQPMGLVKIWRKYSSDSGPRGGQS